MFFNSAIFAIFLAIVYIVYWRFACTGPKIQNAILLLASLLFYGWWDVRFLALLCALTFLNYAISNALYKQSDVRFRHLFLWMGVMLNLSALGVFKYCDFFIDGFIAVGGFFGLGIQHSSMTIVLPLGISIYTFLAISYFIEIFRANLKPVGNIIELFLSLHFFPIIFSGPIQRPITLLPQIQKTRLFEYDKTTDGLRQILWGFFVKTAIADTCAIEANNIFNNYSSYAGSTLVLGAIIYSVQIYADFSGYSNIAIGVAKLFGFDVMRNFSYPYFSRNIVEYWRRWNISLTTWFRDYIFLPIAYYCSRKADFEKFFFVKKDIIVYTTGAIVTWFLTGLWHGSNYTFIAWGLIHGAALIAYRSFEGPAKRLLKHLQIPKNNYVVLLASYMFTMTIVLLAWIFFRSDSLRMAVQYISIMFSGSLFSVPQELPKLVILLICVFLSVEWLQRGKQHALQIDQLAAPRFVRWGLYYAVIFIIIWFNNKPQQFIYFQF